MGMDWLSTRGWPRIRGNCGSLPTRAKSRSTTRSFATPSPGLSAVDGSQSLTKCTNPKRQC
eukprot:8912799-Pyramimonas_sp.AAC.1